MPAAILQRSHAIAHRPALAPEILKHWMTLRSVLAQQRQTVIRPVTLS